ncbi:hypothetical protein BH11VER1_BH11VER1_09980 [soil metagenome]
MPIYPAAAIPGVACRLAVVCAHRHDVRLTRRPQVRSEVTLEASCGKSTGCHFASSNSNRSAPALSSTEKRQSKSNDARQRPSFAALTLHGKTNNKDARILRPTRVRGVFMIIWKLMALSDRCRSESEKQKRGVHQEWNVAASFAKSYLFSTSQRTRGVGRDDRRLVIDWG